jgi:hypothetical protein
VQRGLALEGVKDGSSGSMRVARSDVKARLTTTSDPERKIEPRPMDTEAPPRALVVRARSRAGARRVAACAGALLVA